MSVEALVNNLVFGVSHARFEEAWSVLGTILGFKSERPEEELGKGPPVAFGDAGKSLPAHRDQE